MKFNEPGNDQVRHKCAVLRENLSLRFSTRSDTNRAVQPQKYGLRLEILDLEGIQSMQRKQRR